MTVTILAKRVWKNPLHVISFGFGSGLLPKMPGTWGTLVAMPSVWLLRLVPLNPLVMLILFTVIACCLCHYTAKSLGIGDHPGIVVDEFVGYYWAVFMLPMVFWVWLLAFAVFRVFDIWKPWPIRWFEKCLPGGVGIVADDCIAGLYTVIILNFLLAVL